MLSYGRSLTCPLPSPAAFLRLQGPRLARALLADGRRRREECRRLAWRPLFCLPCSLPQKNPAGRFHRLVLPWPWIDTALMADAWSPTYTTPRTYMIHAPHFRSLLYSTLPRGAIYDGPDHTCPSPGRLQAAHASSCQLLHIRFSSLVKSFLSVNPNSGGLKRRWIYKSASISRLSVLGQPQITHSSSQPLIITSLLLPILTIPQVLSWSSHFDNSSNPAPLPPPLQAFCRNGARHPHPGPGRHVPHM